MAQPTSDQPHGQDNEDTVMNDRSLGSLSGGDPGNSFDNQGQDEAVIREPTDFEAEVPNNATRYLPGAMRWADATEGIGHINRFKFACINFRSIDGTTGEEFYLSAEDSKAFILHIARNPQKFNPAPQPVPSQNIQPQRHNHLQQGIPTALQQGAAFWTEADDGRNIYPRRDYASVAGRYDSYQSSRVAGFWLNVQDTNHFFRHLIANPDSFPFGPAPAVPNPLGAQLMSITHKFDQLLEAHNLVGQEPYGGETIHGSQQMYQYSRANRLDPRQYAKTNKWKTQKQGPPPDQVSYDSTMAGGNRRPDEGYNSFYSNFQDDQSDQDDEEDEEDEEHGEDEEDEIEDKQAEDQVFSETRWEKDPGRLKLYRMRFPNSEGRRCQTCERRKVRCLGWRLHRFPCDTCIKAKKICVRQRWQHQRKLRPFQPWPQARKAKCVAPGMTAGLPQTNCGEIQGNVLPTKLRSPPVAQDNFCFRCKKNDLACDGQNPCNMCIADDSPEFCGNYDNLGLPWSFEENEPGEDYGWFGGGNEMEGNGDAQMNDNVDTVLSLNEAIDPQLLAEPYPQFGAGPARNIGESITAGALPSGLPEPITFHNFILPTRPHPLKRPAPDAGADDDDAINRTEEPPKKKRGRPTGSTKAKIARENAECLAQSQTNVYDPSNNKIPDPLNLPGFDVDDPMVLDQPLGSGESRGRQRSELVASTWKIFGLPPKPSRFSNRALVPENKEQKCVENVNHWTINPFVDCDRTPTRLCQEMSDNRRYTDVSCHDRQEIAVRQDERAVIEKSKLLYCEPCYFDLRLNINQGYVHLQVCQCAWQMSRTWLCNKDRVKARHDFLTRIGPRKMNWLNIFGNVCPACKMRPPEEGIDAWQCCACEAKVFRDPMVP